MKKLLISGLLISLFVMTGCIEITTVINVNPDGSGTIDETVLMSKEVVVMISEFTGAFAEDTTGSSEKFSLFNEAEVKEKATQYGAEVKYISGKELSIDGKEGYMVTYSFPDINNLEIDQSPGNKISMDPSGAPLETEKEIVKFKFQKGVPSILTINLPENKPDEYKPETDTISTVESDEAADTAAVEKVLKMLEGLKISVLLNINGSIVETNATHVNGSAITIMNLSFAEILKSESKLNEFKSINPANIDQLKEMLKSIPGIQMELNNPVTVKFK